MVGGVLTDVEAPVRYAVSIARVYDCLSQSLYLMFPKVKSALYLSKNSAVPRFLKKIHHAILLTLPCVFRCAAR